MSTHTKGPWKAKIVNVPNALVARIVCDTEGEFGCEIANLLIPRGLTEEARAEFVANAHLIAAAPSLDALIIEIEAVACGEEQLQADGVYDDSDGLKWIYDRIQSARATIEREIL